MDAVETLPLTHSYVEVAGPMGRAYIQMPCHPRRRISLAWSAGELAAERRCPACGAKYRIEMSGPDFLTATFRPR